MEDVAQPKSLCLPFLLVSHPGYTILVGSLVIKPLFYFL